MDDPKHNSSTVFSSSSYGSHEIVDDEIASDQGSSVMDLFLPGSFFRVKGSSSTPSNQNDNSTTQKSVSPKEPQTTQDTESKNMEPNHDNIKNDMNNNDTETLPKFSELAKKLPPNSIQIQEELFYLCSIGKSPHKDPPSTSKQDQKLKELESTEPFKNKEKESERQAQISQLQKEKQFILDEYILSCVQEYCSQGAMLNVCDDQENTPLHSLSILGAPKTIQWCLENGAKHNVRGYDGGTPLLWAASGREDSSIDVLAEHGAQVNISNKDGESALYLSAVKMRHALSVKALLKHGAKVTEQLLLQAATRPENPSVRNMEISLDILALLLRQKNDLQYTSYNSEGDNAILYTFKNWKDAFILIWSLTHVNLKTILPNQFNPLETLLYLVCTRCEEDDTDLLVDLVKRYDLNKEHDSNGGNPLFWVLEKPLFMKLLIKNGININYIDNNGETALHHAVRIEDLDARVTAMKILLAHNIDKTIKNKEDKTARDLTSDEVKDSSARALLDADHVTMDPPPPEETVVNTKTPVNRTHSSTITIDINQHIAAEKVLYQGHLVKESKTMKKWRKRFFKLTTTHLAWHEEQGTSLKNSIAFQDMIPPASLAPDKTMTSLHGTIPLANCFRIDTKKGAYFLLAQKEQEAKGWVDAINEAKEAFDEQRRQSSNLLKEDPTKHPDFTGTWSLDLQASDSLDSVLKNLGKSWLDRKMADKTPLIQKITQTHAELRVQTAVKLTDKLSRTEILSLDGTEEIRESTYSSGKVRSRTGWSPDGQCIVSRSELPNGHVIITGRSIKDQNMIYEIKVILKDASEVGPVKRIFRKK